MNNRAGLIVLILLCLGLGAALLYVRKQAAEDKRVYNDRILTLSNNWSETSVKLEDQKQVTTLLEKDIQKQKEGFEKSLTELTNEYSQTLASLAKSESSLKSAQEELTRRDQRIAELENQNKELDKQAIDLSTAITNLTVQISETQRKLAASEGDKAFLQKELKRLMAEKAELERQFNDLAVLRAQVAKLKEELSIARRLDWVRRGLLTSPDQKGAAQLMQGIKPPRAAITATNYDLNVELSTDGKVKVLSPTNAPQAR
jgi:chromosome segregation ATPase